MAVERNGRIIPVVALARTPVVPGDRIEVIQFVGGG
jgi:thiamine biosynthesis protein ThiS